MGETAGYCSQLVAGFRAIGLRAEHLDLGPNPLGYASGPPATRVRLARWLECRRRGGPGPRIVWTLLHRLAMAALLAHALVRHDAFVLRAGDSFLGLRDLPLLRALGKRVVVVFFGSDSRPSYLNGAEAARGVVGARAADETAAKRRVVERVERHASAVICHVMSAQLHTRRTIAFLAVGIPRDPGAPLLPLGPRGAGAPIRVLHAPSRLQDKGTQLVRDAVEAARASGVEVELEIVTGRPNREVLAAIAGCDFVVDQVFGDTPMGGFAAEAAARGRPAVVGGYGWDELRRVSDPAAMPPSHLCRPDELADAIVALATDDDRRHALGEAARRHVAQGWAPAEVARRFVAILSGEAPDGWWFDPAEVVYAHGVGMSEPAVSRAIGEVLDARGTAGLGVRDKPLLERRLVELAGRR